MFRFDFWEALRKKSEVHPPTPVMNARLFPVSPDEVKGAEEVEIEDVAVVEPEQVLKSEDALQTKEAEIEDAKTEDAGIEDEAEELAVEPEPYVSVPRQGDEIIKDELTLAEFPIALVSNRVPIVINPDGTKAPLKTIEWNGWVSIDGKRIPQKWTVTGSEAYGLPTAIDDDTFMAILAAGSRSGFKSQAISLPSIYSMRKLLNRGVTGGRESKRLTQSLMRLKGLTFYTEYAVKDKNGLYVKTRGFNLIDEFELTERYRPGDRRRKVPNVFGYVKLSDTVYDWIKNGNLKDLNYTTYQKLPSQLSRRMFRYYDKQRYRGESCTRNVFNLCLKLGFARTAIQKYSPQKFKDLLTPALDELVLINFLSRYEWKKNAEKALVLAVFFSEPGSGRPYGLNEEQAARAQLLAKDIAEVLGQAEKNKGYYFKTASLAVRDDHTSTVIRALSETKAADIPQGTIRNRSQYFDQRMKDLRPAKTQVQ